MTRSPVLLVLLQVFCLHLVAVAVPTCRLEGGIIQEAHNLLRDLGAPFPLRCQPYNANISFPRSALPAPSANHAQCRQVLWVVSESLQEAGQMFEDPLPVGGGGVTWNDQKLQKFRHLQHRVMEDSSCLSGVDGVLSSYFSNVTSVLEQPDGAACGLMALRRDLLWVLKSSLKRHASCFTWRDAARTTPTHLRGHAH